MHVMFLIVHRRLLDQYMCFGCCDHAYFVFLKPLLHLYAIMLFALFFILSFFCIVLYSSSYGIQYFADGVKI